MLSSPQEELSRGAVFGSEGRETPVDDLDVVARRLVILGRCYRRGDCCRRTIGVRVSERAILRIEETGRARRVVHVRKRDRNDRDGTPISVLRTIEIRTRDREKRIGLNLIALMGHVVPGHIATRPLGQEAKSFSEKIGFISPPMEAQLAFEDWYGYLLLPPAAK